MSDEQKIDDLENELYHASEYREAAEDECKELEATLAKRNARIADLEAELAKVPKTADGVSVVPGVSLWEPVDSDENSHRNSGWLMDEKGNLWNKGMLSLVPKDSAQKHKMQFRYSTREAALASRAEGGSK